MRLRPRRPACRIGSCDRPTGAGTYVFVRLGPTIKLRVCEEHWQALKFARTLF